MKLPSIEPILQTLRIQKIKSHISKDGILIDIGCDTPPKLLNSMKGKIHKGIGIDEVVETHTDGNLSFIKQSISKKINVENNTADTVTMLAVLEHMKYPEEIAKECFRILKKDGNLLITVPSPKCQPLLEKLAPLGLVRESMIDQHENYFTHKHLRKILKNAGFSEILINNFELGYNTFAKATKK